MSNNFLILPVTNASFNILNIFVAGKTYQNLDSPMLLKLKSLGLTQPV